MNKTVLQVPKGIRYISDYEKEYGFHLEEFPYILDKKIPGCGFTHWCLSNSQNIILASPRKMLMENKKGQFGDSVFLVKIEQEDINVDKDLTKITKYSPAPQTYVFDRAKMIEDIRNYISDRIKQCAPLKIIVTYDSYRKIKEILEELKIFDSFYTVTDEFQSAFVDGKFKSTTELEFLSTLEKVKRVCFVSATPMMEEYLDAIDYFKNLPYYVLDWETLEPSRIKKPKITVKSLKSINLAAKAIIAPYKDGKFDYRLVIDPETGTTKNVESREAVIYVNSVTNIIGIIKACKLKPEEVNILCSNTPYNEKRIRTKLTRKRDGLIYEIGKIPLPGEPRKMFTFCTRTVYLGADFYSDNARTFILSDANIDTLAVDITLDLPQILGRQRLTSNPWKDEAILYVRPILRKNVLNESDFQKYLSEKVNKTKNLLNSYEDARPEAKSDLVEVYDRSAKTFNYSADYVAVNHHSGAFPIPVFNTLVAVAEKRAFDIQQKDYASRFSVFNMVMKKNLLHQEQTLAVQQFLEEFYKIATTRERLKYICTVNNNFTEEEWEQVFSEVPDFYRNFYLGLGPDRCKALGYSYTLLQKDYNVKFFNSDVVRNSILSIFSVGDKLSKAEIKQRLADLYSSLNYKKSPKASDLEDFFELKSCKVKDSDGNWINGFELLNEIKL